MTISKVALIGANGKLGPAILHALISAGTFTVTVLSRSSSSSVYPDSVRVKLISDHPSIEELTHVLRGQDALIVAVAGSNSPLQIRLADAAAHAGVRRFIPADFGSCDSSNEWVLSLLQLYRAKQEVRRHLQQLASTSTLSWTSLVCGHFFDYGLRSGLLQFDVQKHWARIFDGGEIRWSATTVGTIATAVVRVLQKEDETKNRMLYIQSFSITQNEVLRSLEQITRQNWQVEHADSNEYIKKVKSEVDQESGNGEAIENLVSVMGMIDANWETKNDFSNSLLGLTDESLDEVVKKVVGE